MQHPTACTAAVIMTHFWPPAVAPSPSSPTLMPIALFQKVWMLCQWSYHPLFVLSLAVTTQIRPSWPQFALNCLNRTNLDQMVQENH